MVSLTPSLIGGITFYAAQSAQINSACCNGVRFALSCFSGSHLTLSAEDFLKDAILLVEVSDLTSISNMRAKLSFLNSL